MSLSDFLRSLQSRPKDELLGLSEFNSRKWIVEPVLQELGWHTNPVTDVLDVKEEYLIRNGKVDYCLHNEGKNKVFIEAKKPSETLVHHQPQLFDYVRYGDTELAILTNCLDWWFYLPSAKEPWQQKPFLTLNLLTGDLDPLAKSLDFHLSKLNIVSGSAFDGAETALEEQQRTALIEEGLPRAWKRLIFEEDEKIIELLTDTVEQNEGQRPLETDVRDFVIKQQKLYEPIETREEKKREKQRSPKRQTRHKPVKDSMRENKAFYQRILQEKFSSTFTAVPRYRNLQGSSDDLVWFGGFSKEKPVWFYRVDTGQLELLRSDTRKSTLCFTNAVEKAAYIIPLNDVEEQLGLLRSERDSLQANIYHANDLWKELDWNIRRYFKRFD